MIRILHPVQLVCALFFSLDRLTCYIHVPFRYIILRIRETHTIFSIAMLNTTHLRGLHCLLRRLFPRVHFCTIFILSESIYFLQTPWHFYRRKYFNLSHHDTSAKEFSTYRMHFDWYTITVISLVCFNYKTGTSTLENRLIPRLVKLSLSMTPPANIEPSKTPPR